MIAVNRTFKDPVARIGTKSEIGYLGHVVL